jgi:hypothetical protein
MINKLEFVIKYYFKSKFKALLLHANSHLVLHNSDDSFFPNAITLLHVSLQDFLQFARFSMIVTFLFLIFNLTFRKSSS